MVDYFNVQLRNLKNFNFRKKLSFQTYYFDDHYKFKDLINKLLSVF